MKAISTSRKHALKRVRYVKRKCSNAGKVSVTLFSEHQEAFVADINAEVLMNEISDEVIFNWDQTGLLYQLEMDHALAGEKASYLQL